MYKKSLLLLLFPLVLTSCGDNHAGYPAVKNKVDAIPYTAQYPYYRVRGSLDFNGELLAVDALFNKEPSPNTFVPYARYNEGFYCPKSSANESSVASKYGQDEVKIFMMGSRSYWLRAPMRLHNENFYTEVGEDNEENKTCGHYILEHIITSFKGEEGSINPSWNKMYCDILPDGGFAFGGEGVHTVVKIDNYPYYPDPTQHPEISPWSALFNPLPCYKNEVNLKGDIRFEYNAEGWLTKEILTSTGYDYTSTTRSQVSLIAEYTYQFN